MVTFDTKQLKQASLKCPEIEKLLKGESLKVGFFENARYPSGEFVAQVAKWNEIGTIRAPARPFMRGAVAKHGGKWLDKLPAIYNKAGFDNTRALGIMGEMIRADIIREITAFSSPANAQSTIKAKGSSHPLIDTGLMRRSVTYRVGE